MTDSLPPTWVTTTVGTVSSGMQYGYTASASDTPCGPRFLRITDIQDGSVEWSTVPYCEIDQESITKYAVRDGDVLVARTGGTVGKSFLIRNPLEVAVFASYLIRISPSRAVAPGYLAHYFQSAAYWQQIGLKKGGLLGNVNSTTLSSVELPLGPEPEQQRIVSKLDELFSRIDEGVRALERVQALVERYRQSVLKTAVTGELTREWREKNKGKLESGEALLARILKARREAWEKAELEKMKLKGITPANDKWKQKYEEPSPPDKSDLPELPDGWTWCSGAQLFAWASGDFLPAKAMQPGDVPVYGGNGVNGQHSEANVDSATVVVGRVGVHCGNVRISASRSWVTDNAIYATRLPALASLAFLLICLRSAQLGKTSQGGAQPFVNQKALNEVAVPLPSVEEQVAAVDVLATETSRLDAVLASVEAESKRMAVLKQAVLKCAFSGGLVAQDPTDESASTLLERTSAERGTDNAVPKRGRKKKIAA